VAARDSSTKCVSSTHAESRPSGAVATGDADRPGRLSYSHSTSPPKRAKSSKPTIVFALSVLFAVWAGVAWRLWLTDRVTFEGPLRQGSLRCDDECHFDFVVEAYGGTRVRAETCIMPDALRDWPGRPVRAMIAGTWEGQRRFKATALFVRSNAGWPVVKQRPVSSITGAKGAAATGRPPACFVPPERQ
jgi:hypothetical protein